MKAPNERDTPPESTLTRPRGPTPAAEVARRAGVSLMTVSRVFNDSPLVATKTRDKVQQIARQLGYHPNMAARVLRTGKAETVGYVLSSANTLRAEFHAESLVAFESVVSARRLSVTLSAPSGEETLTDRVKRLVASSRCGAMVVQFDALPEHETEEFARLDAPVVLANHPGNPTTQRLAINTVGFDNADGMAQATRHLATLGHVDIAYLGGTLGFMDSIDRENGFRRAMKAASLKLHENWIKPCDFSEGHATGQAAMDAILSAPGPRPTAVVCASDEIAAGVLTAARKAGLAVPQQLSIVGFDDMHWTRFSVPPLTTVRHSGHELGRRMGEIILYLYDNQDLPARQEQLKTELIVRDSTAPR